MLSIEGLYSSSIKLLDYLTHYYKINAFLIDEVDDTKVRALRDAIVKEDKLAAVKLYLALDKECDMIRDRYCFNNSELPYRSNFRAIAKDLYRELKIRHLTNHDDLKTVARILRFISTSDYYTTREYLIKRSLSWYMYCNVPLNPNDFPGGYIYLEAIMDYCIKISNIYLKWR